MKSEKVASISMLILAFPHRFPGDANRALDLGASLDDLKPHLDRRRPVVDRFPCADIILSRYRPLEEPHGL